MSKFPHLPLFTDAFIADTGHLSAQETGAYLMLLMTAWRAPECRLPDDDVKLSRWARVDARNWTRVKPAVLAFWTLADGYWTQRRLRREWEYVSAKQDRNRENGKLGGRPAGSLGGASKRKIAEARPDQAATLPEAKLLKMLDVEKPLGFLEKTETKAPIPIPIASPKGEAAGEAAKGDPRDVKSFIDRMLADFPAFGAQVARSPLLLSPRELNLWIGQGLDLAADIEPVVREILGRPKAPPSTWGYFHAAIIRHHEQRLSLPAPATGLSVGSPSSSSSQNPDGTRRPSADGAIRVTAVNLTGGGANHYEPNDPDMAGAWRLRVRLFLKGHGWSEEHLGAPPDHPACLCPPRIIERCRSELAAEMTIPAPARAGSTATH